MFENKSIKNLLIILCFFAATYLYSVYQESKVSEYYNLDEKELMVNNLPDISFDMLGSKVVVDKNYFSSIKKDYVVLHFWGTWCPPCIPEFPEFVEFAKKFENKDNALFVLVAVNDEVESVKKFLKTYKLPSNVIIALDKSGEEMNKFGAVKVPETHIYFKDRSVKRYVGPQKWNNDYYFNYLDKLL